MPTIAEFIAAHTAVETSKSLHQRDADARKPSRYVCHLDARNRAMHISYDASQAANVVRGARGMTCGRDDHGDMRVHSFADALRHATGYFHDAETPTECGLYGGVHFVQVAALRHAMPQMQPDAADLAIIAAN